MLVLRTVCVLLVLGWVARVAPAARAQAAVSEPRLFEFGRPKQQRTRVPLQLQRNLLVVSVLLNNSGPYNFLLDPGVGISLITDPTVAPFPR